MKKSIVLAALALFLSTGVAMAGVNVNTASKAELTKLPGIGQARAEAIVQYRKAHGNFDSLAELAKIDGIGEATVNGLKGKASTGGGDS